MPGPAVDGSGPDVRGWCYAVAAAFEPEPLPVVDGLEDDEPDDEPESEEELLELDSLAGEPDDSLAEPPEPPDSPDEEDLPAAAEAADDLAAESRLSLR